MLLGIAPVLVLGACGVIGGPDTTPTDQQPVVAPSDLPVPVSSDPRVGAEGTQNPLTGEPVPPDRVLAVAVDGTPEAAPQVGLDQADVVYLDGAEGDATGPLAVFQTEVPSRVGPVRAATAGDVDLLDGYGGVAFAAVGADAAAAAGADPSDTDLQLLSPDTAADGFLPDPARTAPFDLLADGPALLDAARGSATAPDVGFRFGEAPDDGSPVESASYELPASTFEVEWSEDEDAWVHLDGPGVLPDGAGAALTSDTVLFLAQREDAAGSEGPAGGGEVTVLRDGQAFPGSWSRDPATGATTFEDDSGDDLLLDQGSVWVVLTGQDDPPALVSG